MGSCIDPNTIQGATYQILESSSVKERVKQTIQNQQMEAFEKFKTNQTVPLTILNLYLDSVSRKLFFRKFPLTVKFLNALNEKKYKVYDFKLHSVIGDNSLPNLFPT